MGSAYDNLYFLRNAFLFASLEWMDEYSIYIANAEQCLRKTPKNTFNWSGGEKTKLTANDPLKESVTEIYMPYTQSFLLTRFFSLYDRKQPHPNSSSTVFVGHGMNSSKRSNDLLYRIYL